MADQWYYAWSQERFGPFSTAQLRDLEARGKIQPTDTVWQEGIEQGIRASNVPGLFEDLHSQALTSDAASQNVGTVPTVSVPAKSRLPQISEVLVPASAGNGESSGKSANTPEPEQAVPVKKVTAITGATILSQDGEIVRFRKKCARCGQEDSCRTEARITPGLIRQQFYCSKCRKQFEVLLRGP